MLRPEETNGSCPPQIASGSSTRVGAICGRARRRFVASRFDSPIRSRVTQGALRANGAPRVLRVTRSFLHPSKLIDMTSSHLLHKLWDRTFLEERPSVSLCLFRFFAAFTVGAHILPTFVHLEDNYLHTAFKEKNFSFFTPEVLNLVEQSPDDFVVFMTVFFCIALVGFAVGFLSQVSCILMVLGCYYFYALNALHIGTLSYDILLVTLFLMCVTGYHGDSFSVDAWIRRDKFAYRRKRPFFIQRLLQLQIASTFFYTALCKVSTHGNWLTDNPMYYLYNSTPESVVKHFPLRSFLAQHPDLCYATGIAVIVMEFAVSFLLFTPRARAWAIAAGIVFHVLLVVTLHVPTIFLFLFPAQLCLFIPPEKIVARLDSRKPLFFA